MSSFRFPAIQTKKSILEQQDYNFVNKDKKKKPSTGAMEIVQQLKRKIEQQKKQIQNRNMTIQGLQRNFESLSVIVKNQKATTSALRAQLQALRSNSESGDRRAADFHEKCILLQRENKALKEEVRSLRKMNGEYSQYERIAEQLKEQVGRMEQVNNKLHARITQGQADRQALQTQISALRGIQREKRVLNERVVDLQDEVKTLTDLNNALTYKNTLAQDEKARKSNEIVLLQKKVQELVRRQKDSGGVREKLQAQLQQLRKQNQRLSGKLDDNEKAISTKDLLGKLKQDQQDKLRKQLRQLAINHRQLQQQHNLTQEQLKGKRNLLEQAEELIKMLKKQIQDQKDRFLINQQDYKQQIQKLRHSLNMLQSQLNNSTGNFHSIEQQLNAQQQRSQTYNQQISSLQDHLDDINRQMQQHQQKYGQYFKLIARNEPDVVITNQRDVNSQTSKVTQLNQTIRQLQLQLDEARGTAGSQTSSIDNMRTYIKSLQQEVKQKSQELAQVNRQLRKYQLQEEQLNKMIKGQRQNAIKLKEQAERDILQRMRELQNEKMRSKKQIEEERARLQDQLQRERQANQQRLRAQQQRTQKYNRVLAQYQQEERSLKELMAKEQDQMTRLAQQKEQAIAKLVQQKEQQIEKERKQIQKERHNNKLLWSDNKKLKDIQAKLREDSDKMLQQKELASRQQMERIKREMQEKYKGAISDKQTSSGQLKKILLEKGKQFQTLSDSYQQAKNDCEFYKNRNKQLQALTTRLDTQLRQKSAQLSTESSTNKQLREVLQKKLKDAQKQRGELQLQHKKQIKALYNEIQDLKDHARSQKVQEKIAIVNSSLGDLDTSLKALMNGLSCNYCMEVVKDCVRLECGHIYCRKCKGGYEPNCGQCKRQSKAVPDKMVDESVSKAQYMRILINTIKDDLSKISK